MADYFVLTKLEDDRNAVLSEESDFPDNHGWRVAVGEPITDIYPEGVRIGMDEDFRGMRIVDFIDNTLNYCLVSEKLKNLMLEHSEAHIEFLPFEIINHKERVVPGLHYIANILDIVDCIDLDKSDYDDDEITPGEISDVDELHISEDKVPPGAKLFRLGRISRLILIRDDLRRVFDDAGVIGIRYIPMGGDTFFA